MKQNKKLLSEGMFTKLESEKMKKLTGGTRPRMDYTLNTVTVRPGGNSDDGDDGIKND